MTWRTKGFNAVQNWIKKGKNPGQTKKKSHQGHGCLCCVVLYNDSRMEHKWHEGWKDLRVQNGSKGEKILGRSMWDLWWTKWHWDRFFSEYFGFFLSISFHRCSIKMEKQKKPSSSSQVCTISLQCCGASVASAAGPFNNKKNCLPNYCTLVSWLCLVFYVIVPLDCYGTWVLWLNFGYVFISSSSHPLDIVRKRAWSFSYLLSTRQQVAANLPFIFSCGESN